MRDAKKDAGRDPSRARRIGPVYQGPAASAAKPNRAFRSATGATVLSLVPLLSLLLGSAGASFAEVATIDVLFDLDLDPGTGCSVTTIEGDVDGIELRLRTEFDVGLDSLLATATAHCIDPVLDAFGAETSVPTAPQPTWQGAPGNGASGSTLIETHLPGVLAGTASQARAFVVVSSLVGDDVLLAGDGGEPLLVGLAAPRVPALGLVSLASLMVVLVIVSRVALRSHAATLGLLSMVVVTSLLLPGRGLALLGEGVFRVWTAAERIGTDPRADAPLGLDLLDFYADFDAATSEVWLRMDVLFGAPVCNAWGTVDPGTGYQCSMQPPLDSGPFGGAVAMTFDDGPHEVVTPQVLATLRAHGIPATFFLVGTRLVTPTEQALALEIHQDPLFRIGSHNYTHRRMNTLTPEEIDFEVPANNDQIRAAIGDPCYFPQYFRLPFAASTCYAMSVVRSHGMASAAVDIDTSDWCYGVGDGFCYASMVPFIPDEFRDDLPGYVVDRYQASGGGILVMHDIHTNTAAQLPAVIAALQAAGATFVDLADPVLFPIMNSTITVPEGPACCEGVVN